MRRVSGENVDRGEKCPRSVVCPWIYESQRCLNYGLEVGRRTGKKGYKVD